LSQDVVGSKVGDVHGIKGGERDESSVWVGGCGVLDLQHVAVGAFVLSMFWLRLMFSRIIHIALVALGIVTCCSGDRKRRKDRERHKGECIKNQY
jgi:hypothetical protein